MTYYSKLTSTLETGTTSGIVNPIWSMNSVTDLGKTTNLVRHSIYDIPATGEAALITGPATGSHLDETQSILIKNTTTTAGSYVWVRFYVKYGEADFAGTSGVTGTGYCSFQTNVQYKYCPDGTPPYPLKGQIGIMTSGDLNAARQSYFQSGTVEYGQNLVSAGAMTGGVFVMTEQTGFTDTYSPASKKLLVPYPILNVYTDSTTVGVSHNIIQFFATYENYWATELHKGGKMEFGFQNQLRIPAGDQLQIPASSILSCSGFNTIGPTRDSMPLSLHGDSTNKSTVEIMIVSV